AILKFCSERCVCAPQRRSAGTSMGPKVSFSMRFMAFLISRKTSARGQQVEARFARGVLGDDGVGRGVAGAAFGVDDLQARRGAGAVAGGHEVELALREQGGAARGLERLLRADALVESGAHLGAGLALRRVEPLARLDLVDLALARLTDAQRAVVDRHGERDLTEEADARRRVDLRRGEAELAEEAERRRVVGPVVLARGVGGGQAAPGLGDVAA